MSNLVSSLVSAASSLSVFERALVVSQNNVTNASTPGYAAQRLTLQAMSFDPDLGLVGGVRAGEIQSARSEYAEQSVRRQLESLGYFEQKTASLASVESAFDVTGEAGIPGALNQLFQSFSAWSLTPNSTAARQQVIENAQQLAGSFQETATRLTNASVDADRQLRDTVSQINALGAQLHEYNLEIRRGAQNDAGLDTKIHVALEALSELVDFSTVVQSDGSLAVLIGGQTPLVIGDNQYPISASFNNPANPPPVHANAPPTAHILNANGDEITAQIAAGKLGGLLDVRNRVLPSLVGDAYQAGELNRLAKGIADRVNDLLTAGQVSDGPPPVAGTPLFAYDANDTTVAQSIRLDPGITAANLAAIDPGPPYASNGIALKLAALSDSQDAVDRIDGFSFTEFYGNLGAMVGRELADAKDGQDFKAQTVAQARSLRTEISGVSLDEEAILLIEFQRAYQAVARAVSVLNDLTETAVNLYR